MQRVHQRRDPVRVADVGLGAGRGDLRRVRAARGPAHGVAGGAQLARQRAARGSRTGRSGPAPLGLDRPRACARACRGGGGSRSARRSSARRRRPRSPPRPRASASASSRGSPAPSACRTRRAGPRRAGRTRQSTRDEGEDVHPASVGSPLRSAAPACCLPRDPSRPRRSPAALLISAPAAHARPSCRCSCRATRRPRRCVRILTPGSSAPCPGSASAAIADRFGAEHFGLGGYEVARRSARGVRERAAQARAAGLRRRPTRPARATAGRPGRPALGAAERLAREGRRAGADAAAGRRRRAR